MIMKPLANLLLALYLFTISKCRFTVSLKSLSSRILHLNGSLARPWKGLETHSVGHVLSKIRKVRYFYVFFLKKFPPNGIIL